MNSAWQQLTLANLSLAQWRGGSYLYRLVGPLQAWRQSSWLMQWSEPIGALLLSFVFGLAPFVSNGLIGMLLAACLGYWALLTISDSAESKFSTPIHLLVLLYWGVSTVATALSPVKQAALVGWGKLTLYLVLFALMARILRSPRLRSWVITLYLHVSLIVSVYGLQQWRLGTTALATWVDPESPLAKTTRVYSYLGNPNLLAGYLVPAVAFSIAACFAWRRWPAKALAATMTLVNTSCLMLTFSRGGWIGVVAAGFVLLMLLTHWLSTRLPRFWQTWLLPMVLGGVTGFLVLAVLLVEPLRDRVASIFAGRGDSSNNFRINVWAGVIRLIQDDPDNRLLPNYILGVGPGNTVFNKIYPTYMVSPRYSALSAYSILLEIIVETGLIGLTCFAWLLLTTFTQGWLQLQRLRNIGSREGFWLMAAIASLVGMLVHGLVDTVWYRPQISTLWWLMIAIIASYYVPQPLADKNSSAELPQT
ncbi:IctB family putative bicarbonate transporter [Trichocoleus desertorum AS-A10]|uniref:IctB family putative bicarbonate transporter n=1 Tax=Trichocoleus desertorum TaxID=1481672 RepID=UPI0032981A62